jgi:hypothetical protein
MLCNSIVGFDHGVVNYNVSVVKIYVSVVKIYNATSSPVRFENKALSSKMKERSM